MIKKALYYNKINTTLTIFAHAVGNKNKLSLNDDNKWAEDFFKELLNLVCGYNLTNLNNAETNYAGVDLGDLDKKTCIQVTATNDSQKIKDTLAISDKYKRYEEYEYLIVLIIGYKKKYTSKFVTNFKQFDAGNCIWDIQTLLAKIQQLDADSMHKVMEFLDKELTEVITINPLDLLDEDIALLIDVLHQYVKEELDGANTDPEQQYKLADRDNDFILRKNNVNNVSDILFSSEIRPNLQYDKKIESFLSNPINKEYQKKYFVVTEILQRKYSENSTDFKSIGDFFGYIFNEVINYKNRNSIDDQKLLILLHNMYFNCDIGNNPTQYA